MANEDVFQVWYQCCNANAGHDPVEKEFEVKNGLHTEIKTKRYEYNKDAVSLKNVQNECMDCLYAQWELYETALLSGIDRALEPPCCAGYYQATKVINIGRYASKSIDRIIVFYLACFCEKKHRYVGRMRCTPFFGQLSCKIKVSAYVSHGSKIASNG